ncbi:MAG: SDR family oxidoreductase [Phycisphaeraceae bacterium]|nr:SDR family oxidoreductase [Phycisphaeraceae bacterium]
MEPVALITGSGSGIGEATARELSARGWRLVLCGRREGPLREVARGLGGPSAIVRGDVGVESEAHAMVDGAVARFGRLDALVNNAGAAPMREIEATDGDVLRETFAVNALGPGYLIARAWPVFVRQRGGCVVNVSSMASIDPFAGFFAYASSKASVNLMAKSCAMEGGAHGVRAFAVAPGAVETPMLRSLFDERAIPGSRCLSPASVASVIVSCIIGERDSENGAVIPLPSP